MATTKTGITIVASQTLTATNSLTSSGVDLTAAYGLFITARITNGATAPDQDPSFTVEVSNDDSVYRPVATFAGDQVNNSETDFYFIVDVTVMYVRVVFDNPGNQDITIEALGHQLTGV